jgi:phosphoribosylglycinamide formyltransferase-1
MKKIAIMASGSGSNAESIIRFFQQGNEAQVSLVLTDNRDAGVIARAESHQIKVITLSKDVRQSPKDLLNIFIEHNIDLIALAGYLKLIPEAIVRHYTGKIINIHPALLPKFGGKGMYGLNIHKAVIESGDTESGLTIHFVNESYDDGDIIVQIHCSIERGMSAKELAQKILRLEHQYYPLVIQNLLRNEL